MHRKCLSRLTASLLGLLAVLFLQAAAADAPPEEKALAKDDAFYVSAWLRYIAPQSNKSVTIDVRVPPCYEPFVVQGKMKEEELFTAKDPRDVLHGFAGDWSGRLHRTKEECEAKMKEGHAPKVERVEGPESTAGRTYKIVPAEE